MSNATGSQIIAAFSDALDIDNSGFGLALASALVSLAKKTVAVEKPTWGDLKELFHGKKQKTW